MRNKTQSVNLTELKENLSHYLKEVRAGREVLIGNRNRPFAKLVPLTPLNEDDELEAHLVKLATEGKARLPLAPLPPEFWEEPGADVPLEALVAAVRADRDED
jgi:prevent-host-death family protein